jgi:ribonuclease D
VDTEADSLHRYQESLCLVQFSDGKDHVLIDPLAIDDLSPLKRYLEDSVCWMHGADYDMHMLKTNLGMIPPVVFDTQIGARLLGVRQFGYGNLVEHYMGVSLEKTSQKADWAKRPLTEVMEKYALNDVIYLLPMAEMIVSQLKEKGRYEWFVESCEAARAKSIEREPVLKEDRWRIKGSGTLDPEGLNYLKALWMWRDAEAASWDRPSFMVAGNKQLIDWVQSLQAKQKPKMPRHYRSRRLKTFDQAVKSAQAVSKEEWPQKIRGKRRRKDKDFEAKLNQLIAKRNKIAEELDIDGSLIASRTPLEAIAAGHPDAKSLLMSWQRKLLGM